MNKFAVFLSLIFSGLSWSQNTVNSPVSSYGLGEEGPQAESVFGALGNTKTATFDSATVNLHNPASYSQLSKGQPIFSFGISNRNSKIEENGKSINQNVTLLNQIALVIPVNFRLGIALGLQPFSRRGYDFQRTQSLGIDSDSALFNYLGYGTIQNVTVGAAYSIIRKKDHILSFGVNGNYLFGAVTNERRSTLVSSKGPGGIYRTAYRLAGIYGNLGLSYSYTVKKKNWHKLTLATTYTPQLSVNSYLDEEFYAASNVADPRTYDTITFINNNKGTLSLPQKIGVGVNYLIEFKNLANKKINPQLNLLVDFTTTSWSNFSGAFGTTQINAAQHKLSNSTTLAFGAQFTALSDVLIKTTGLDFLKKWRYRAGMYSTKLPYTIGSNTLTENGLTFGLGIPISTTRTNSSVNIGFQAGTRKTPDASQYKESFIGIQFGLLIAPSNYDKWFKKYKLD